MFVVIRNMELKRVMVYTYCFPDLMKLLNVLPRLVTDALPPKPTTRAVTIALLPPGKKQIKQNGSLQFKVSLVIVI